MKSKIMVTVVATLASLNGDELSIYLVVFETGSNLGMNSVNKLPSA
jgi:hypothetical protein